MEQNVGNNPSTPSYPLMQFGVSPFNIPFSLNLVNFTVLPQIPIQQMMEVPVTAQN